MPGQHDSAVAEDDSFRDDADTYLLEAFLRLARGELDACDEALRRSEGLAPSERTAAGIRECRERLREAREKR